MTKEEQLKKKSDIVEYLKHFPFYKWAAASVAISEDTLANWRKVDKKFSDRVEIARSEGIKYFGGKATPDLILKSADPETFGSKDKLDVTSGGKPIQTNTIVFTNFKDATESK